MIELEPATVTINGTKYTAELATAVKTSLGREDHGIFTAHIWFEWHGGGQAAGGYCLDDKPTGEPRRRRGTSFGLDHVMRIIEAFKANDWESIKGKRAFILKTEDRGTIQGIMNADDPNVYIVFADHAKEWLTEST